MATRVQWKEYEYEAVLLAFHQMKEKGELSSKAEQSWRRAQEKALKDPTRWRPFNTSAAATDMNKQYKAAVSAGQFKKKDEPIPQVIQVPQVDLARTVKIGERYVDKQVYEMVVKHHAAENPPKPVTLDSLFRQMMREEAQAVLPDLLKGQLDALREQFAGDLKQTFTTFMKFLDPNYKEPQEQQAVMIEKPTADRVYKPLIAVMHANPAQLQSLQKEFPQFEFKVVRDQMPAGHEPYLILGLTRFMPETLDKQLGKKFPDSYIRVTGAVSDAKTRLKARTANLDFNSQATQH